MGTDPPELAGDGPGAGEEIPPAGEASAEASAVASAPAETWVVEALYLGRPVYLTNSDPTRADAWVDDLEDVTLALDSADEARSWLDVVKAAHGPDALIQWPTIRRVDVGAQLEQLHALPDE